MATLYLTKQNTILRKSGDRLLYCTKPPGGSARPGVRQDEILLDLPCSDIDHVMLFGNVQLTTQAMHQLLAKGIETAIFTIHGELLGQITPPAAKNILLRQAQYKKYEDADFRLDFSRFLVKSKISHSLKLLRDFEHNHPGAIPDAEVAKIDAVLVKMEQATSLPQLLGYEGVASAVYFQILGKMLPQRWQFSQRSRRPPKDSANAMLSFGYVIVTSELRAMLDGIGFDPYLGFYHEIDYGRPSLALDLVEVFRHALVDRLMLKLFNLNILNETDFENVAKGGIYLSDTGKRKFFKQYEDMAGSYRGEADFTNKSKFRAAFQEQVNILMKTVSHDLRFHFILPEIDENEKNP